jgi:hypothetical protein
VPVVPVGGGSAGRTMTGVVVVTGTEVVVVLMVVDELGEVGPPDPAADLGTVVVVIVLVAGSAIVKEIRFENEESLLRATRAKATVRSISPGPVPLRPRALRTRTRAEYVPAAQLFGWCEYTTTRACAERSLSWQVVAWRTVPVTSAWPPEVPNRLGWKLADMTTARAGGVAAALVATRPNVAHMTVASTAATAFMNRCLLAPPRPPS